MPCDEPVRPGRLRSSELALDVVMAAGGRQDHRCLPRHGTSERVVGRCVAGVQCHDEVGGLLDHGAGDRTVHELHLLGQVEPFGDLSLLCARA